MTTPPPVTSVTIKNGTTEKPEIATNAARTSSSNSKYRVKKNSSFSPFGQANLKFCLPWQVFINCYLPVSLVHWRLVCFTGGLYVSFLVGQVCEESDLPKPNLPVLDDHYYFEPRNNEKAEIN